MTKNYYNVKIFVRCLARDCFGANGGYMKSLLKKFCAIAVCVATIGCFAGCNKKVVKNGSVIENMTIVFDVNGKEITVGVELYDNYAPATIEHVKKLVGAKYYNDTIVSDIGSNHVEFGEFYLENGERKSRYDKAASLNYYSVITAEYAKGKKIGKNHARYTEDYCIYGEFNNGGVTRCDKTITVSSGSLVLKRDIIGFDGDGKSSADKTDAALESARGTLALVTGSDSYYTQNDFAAIGYITKGLDDVKKFLSDDYRKSANGAVEYYFDYENCIDDEELLAKFNALGHNFTKDSDGNYFAGSIDVDDEDVLNTLKNKTKFLRIIPAKTITVKSVKVG